MPVGKIKKLVQDKGFGFIAGEGVDIFFHHSIVADHGFDNLTVGQSVDYTIDNNSNPGGKGPRASSVTPN